VTSTTKNIDLTISVPSRTELLEEVRAFVRSAALRFGFVEDDIENIELAVDEACTNIIKHAYKYDPSHEIRIAITSDSVKGAPSKFIIRIFDNGLSFDTTRYSAPDLKEYFSKMQRGGLGIVLMRKIMDEVEYDTVTDNRNSIKLVKYLPELTVKS
jgi:serine/threonine-protein kinase RsbW